MTKTIRTETRQRGFLGKLFKYLFIGFNCLMLAWLITYWMNLGEMSRGADAATQAGTAIGGTLGTGALIIFWAAGDLILGLFTLMTRGKTIIVETATQ